MTLLGIFSSKSRAFSRSLKPPQPLEPCGIGGGIFDGVADVAMPEIVLNEPRIRALVGQGEAASVADHLRVSTKGQGGKLAVLDKGGVDGGTV